MNLKEIVNNVRLENSLKNDAEFIQKQVDEHNNHVDELSLKIYEAYLSQGEDVAKERQEIYKQQNYRTPQFYK